jgi:hypothetical protein
MGNFPETEVRVSSARGAFPVLETSPGDAAEEGHATARVVGEALEQLALAVTPQQHPAQGLLGLVALWLLLDRGLERLLGRGEVAAGAERVAERHLEVEGALAGPRGPLGEHLHRLVVGAVGRRGAAPVQRAPGDRGRA